MPKLTGITLAALFLLLGAGAAHSRTLCGSWNAVPLPGAEGKGLNSVSASSATDVWAVWKAAYHWNGTSWVQVPMPGLGSPDTALRAIAAVASGDAWAVGYSSFLGSPQTLVQHWDGSKWSVVPSPMIDGGSLFDAVAAVDADDAWAVGSRAWGIPPGPTRGTLTAHWDGASWSVVPSPNISNRSHELLDVVAIGSNDVWAVGSYRNIGEDYQTLIVHWDGSSWSITPSPNLPGENVLYGVSAAAANDVWAVGNAWDGVTSRQIFLHWNGASWSQVEGPGGSTACAGCTGDVLAMGPDDVWAIGSTIGHWNGIEWALTPSPTVPGSIGAVMRSLAKIGDCDAWAVGGSFDADGTENALAVRLTPGEGSINQAPIAVASAAPPSGPGPLQVQFSSAGSVDLDGTIHSYHWNFGDSSDPPYRNDPHPVHTFLQTGALTYDVTLSVQDNHGATAQASVRVTITPPLHVEAQDVTRVVSGGPTIGRDVVWITDRDLLPMAGATVTAEYRGPSSGIVTGTTGADGRVTLETPSGGETLLPWCFTVINVEKAGCLYAPGSNVVTEQCESSLASGETTTPRVLALRVSPTPSSGECTVSLSLPAMQDVRVTIVDSSGRKVRELFSAPLPAGEHRFAWDGRDGSNRVTGAGIYFITVQAGDRRISARAVRAR